QAKAASITLEVVVDGELPLVQTDPGKLQQILYNYLSNAIKFSPKESVVSIDATHIVEDSYSTVRIGVIDRGPGIPDDMIDMVFEKFRQVDATHTREHAGTGLGLAICRELAELLRADLSVASEVGKGASFYVDVPEVFTSDEPEALMPE
ncbi:MAG: ATP-binding protein, partial [Phycisphaerales bacterium]|nr:ATP-binding protein [Phycisphaerales bacterium]